ncbi:hypothetical protein TBK1r_62540 [Stieleria magnilauensis]|uniref:Uncharacterized protein n=1 Tax=Stieleria magnilauensis TaxID=2527963 RepID=A0ABX5XYW0_9BACT|nr:hypothetical protein TBK1r_62540 [Planctomycetes bacterium TBK1r]
MGEMIAGRVVWATGTVVLQVYRKAALLRYAIWRVPLAMNHACTATL